MKRLATVLLFFAVSALAKEPVTVPFTTNDDGLVLVQAHAGDIPIQVIFDTGAGLDVLAPSLIDKLHGTPAGRFTGFRMTGERLDIQLYTVPSISLGPMTKRDALVGSWDVLDKFHLAGIISVNDFRQTPITFDFAKKQLVFETAKSLRARRATGASSPLQFDDRRGISLDLFSRFLIAGQPGLCELDTGSPSATVSTRYMPLLGIKEDSPGVQKHEGRSIVGAPEISYRTTVPQLLLASDPQVALHDPPIAFEDIIYDCVVGVDFWRGRALTLDLAHHQLTVSR